MTSKLARLLLEGVKKIEETRYKGKEINEK